MQRTLASSNVQSAGAPAVNSRMAQHPFAGARVGQRSLALGQEVVVRKGAKISARASGSLRVFAIKDGATLDRPLRVAVIGGGPSGACTAETLAKGGVEAFLIERKMDNCKVRVFDWTFAIPALLATCYLPRRWEVHIVARLSPGPM
jgi:geranylgeranyl reductase